MLKKFYESSDPRDVPPSTAEEHKELTSQLKEIQIQLDDLDKNHKEWVNLLGRK